MVSETQVDRIAEGLDLLAVKSYENAESKGFHDVMKVIHRAVELHNPDFVKQTEVILSLARHALIHAEVAEMSEAVRKGDKVNLGEEMADVAIRLGDEAFRSNVSLGEETISKMGVNASRPFMHGKLA